MEVGARRWRGGIVCSGGLAGARLFRQQFLAASPRGVDQFFDRGGRDVESPAFSASAMARQVRADSLRRAAVASPSFE